VLPFRTFRVSQAAVQAARDLGVEGDVEAVLSDMARNSARVTHPDGNRRFEGWVLMVDGDRVVSVSRMNVTVEEEPEGAEFDPAAAGCAVCHGYKVVAVAEECAACDGVGCAACGGAGSMTVRRPCHFALEGGAVCDYNQGY
jgi:hypothetical protein